MSLAKLTIVEKSRKEFDCSGCGKKIPKGSSTVRFSVGFRGRVQTRHNPECFPKPSERESSIVADVYAAQEEADFSGCESPDDVDAVMEDIRSRIEEVSSQYQDNPTYDGNYDLQERVDILDNASQSLDDWRDDMSVDEPDENDPDTWGDYETYGEAREEWLRDMRETAQDFVNNLELP